MSRTAEDMFLRGRSEAIARNLRIQADVLEGPIAERSAAENLGVPVRDLLRYRVGRIFETMAHPSRSPATLGGIEGELHQELTLRARDRGQLVATRSMHGVLIPWQLLAMRSEYLTSSNAAGGYLVESSLQVGSPIDALRPYSIAFQLGAQVDPGQRGDVVYPKLSASAGAAESTEGSAVSESEATAAQIVSTPKQVSSWGSMSRLFRQQSPPGERMVRTDLVRSIAAEVDRLIFQGSGSAGQPTGLINQSGIGTVSGTTLAFAGLNTAVADVLDADAAVSPSTGWAAAPDTAKLLAQRFEDGTSKVQRLWAGSLRRGAVLGELALSSKNVPASTLIYADFEQVVVPTWGEGLELEVNPFSGGTSGDFATGNITYRCFLSMDVVLRYGASVTIISSIT